ncbi:MAG: DUF4388 domain-containing protein [Planctomycetes bacterium]|nr:DUF4388 domain-containing protein [Planctomycetota bacterium]
MAIRGDLLSVDLSNVFQMLAMNRKRGVLRVQNRENILEKRALVLDADRVGLLEIPKAGDLSALLVDEDAIDYAAYTDARTKSRQFGVDPLTFLRKRSTIDDSTLDAVTRRLHEELILEIFLWKNVSFSLDEEHFPEDDDNRRYFNLDLLVMEAARRQDEWIRVVELIGGGRDIWRPIAGEEPQLGDVEHIVFDHLDGTRGTREIMADTGLPRYHVDLAIGRMHEIGCISRLELEDLIEGGDDLLERGRIEDAIRLFKCAVRYDRRSIALHKRLAHAFLKQGRVAKAAAHYKFCAMTLLDNELVRESLAIYEYVVQLLPTDFKALEQVLALLARLEEPLTADDEACLELGLKLCTFYYDSKRFADAERVLRHLMEIAPEDTGLGFILARIQSKTGRIADAVETYMKLAGRLHDQGDLQGALNAYKLVVSFDTASKQICLQRIDHIHAILTRKRRRRRVGAAALVLVGVAAIAAVCYLWYHNRADGELETLLSAEQSVVTEEGWRGMGDRYADFRARFPLTLAAHKAAERISRAEYKIAELREAAKAAREREAARQRACLDRAEQEMARAESLLELRDLEAARKAYLAAQRAAEDSGQAGWADQEPRQIKARIAEIAACLAEEERQIGLIERYLAAGDRGAAYAIARQMIRPLADPLDPGKVHVVSRQAMARVVLPLDVDVRPPRARIHDQIGGSWQGRALVELGSTRQTARLEVGLEGYRSADCELDWRTSPFESHVVLERRESSSLALGDRVVALRLVGNALGVLCGNGSIHLIEPNGGQRRFAPEGFRTPVTEPVVFSGRVAYGTSDGRVLVFDRESKSDREVWSVHPSIDAIDDLIVVGDLLAVATDDGKPRLRFFATADGADQGSVELPAAVQNMAAVDGRVVACLADGSLAIVAAQASELEGVHAGQYRGRPLPFARGLWLVDAEGLLRRVDGSGAGVAVSDQPLVAGASPTLIGDQLVALLACGRLLVVDGSGRSRLLPALPAEFAESATGRVLGGGDGQSLVELADHRWLVVSLIGGQIEDCFRSSSAREAVPLLWLDRLVLGCADDAGTIETYRR